MASRLYFRNHTLGSTLGIPAPPGGPGQEAILIKHCYFRYNSTTTSTTTVQITDAGTGTALFSKDSVAAAATATPHEFEVHDLLCIDPTTELPSQGVNFSNAFSGGAARSLHIVYQYVSSNYAG